jgi:hypothetical protein
MARPHYGQEENVKLWISLYKWITINVLHKLYSHYSVGSYISQVIKSLPTKTKAVSNSTTVTLCSKLIGFPQIRQWIKRIFPNRVCSIQCKIVICPTLGIQSLGPANLE